MMFSPEAGALTAALLLLLAGPVIGLKEDLKHRLEPFIGGFVLVGVVGLVCFHVFPEAVDSAGWTVIIAALAGLAIPTVAEKLFTGQRGKIERAAFAIGIVALAVHAVVDGFALTAAGSGYDPLHGHVHGGASGSISLQVATLLHRLPVALLIWFVGRPLLGTAGAVSALVVLGGGTVVGYVGTNAFADFISGEVVAYLQAVAGGALLHVVLHRADEGHHHAHGEGHTHVHMDSGPAVSPRTTRWWKVTELIGAVAGAIVVALVLWLEHEAGHFHGSAYFERLLSLLLQTAPALLAGYALAGLLAEFLSGRQVDWLGRGTSLRQTAKGVMFGIPLPICSCGVIPVYRSLAVGGVPATAAIAFLVATPEIGIDSIMISIPLLGLPLTGARLLAAFVIALVAGLLIGRLIQQQGASAEHGRLPAPSCDASCATSRDVRASGPAAPRIHRRLGRAFSVGCRDVVDDTAGWILLGLAIAALIEPSALEVVTDYLPGVFEVIFFALAGIPIYVCASGATPLAAMMIMGGVSPGAAIAFLLTGPATNVTTFGVLKNLHGRQVALRFGVLMAVCGMAAGIAINLFLSEGVRIPPDVLLQHSGSTGQWVALVVVMVLFAGSVFRMGVGGFVHTVFHHSH